MALKKIKTDSITDDAITAAKIDDDIYVSTGSFKVPSGTTAQRGSSTTGAFRFNSQTPGFEGYDGIEWGVIGGGSASELSTATTLKLKGSYAETMLFSDGFTLEGDLTLTDNLFLAKLGDDGNNITLTDDGTTRTITGQGTLVPGALFDSSFAIATPAQPNITQIGTTASIKIPTGTTAQRGTALAGGIRYNTDEVTFEGYDGTEWGSLGGIAGITDNSNAVAITIGSDESVTLTGDLIVNGTTTTINSTTLTVDDKNIEMGSVTTPTDGTADGGGIILKGATNKTILWSNSTDTWDFNQGINIEGATSNLATFTSDLTIAASYSMAIIGPVTIPNVTVNGNLNVMTGIDATGGIDTGANGTINIIG